MERDIAMNSKDKLNTELAGQRDLVRRPRKRIAALAIAAGLTVALAVPGAVVFAEGVGTTNSDTATATEQSAESNSNVSGSNASYKKNQVVYVKTDGDGNRTGVYVVNSFDANKGEKIEDTGDYTKVTNLSTTKKLTDKDGKVAVTGQGTQDFVYQGNLNKNTQMPWNVTVSYQLDGKDIDAKDLAGKSGKLSMKLKIEKNADYQGGDYADNYLVQVTGQLKDVEAHNIDAEGATAAANGSNTQLTYMVIPGTTGDYTINADVENFEFDGWQIVGVPLSLALNVDSSSMDTSQLTELSNGIATANIGAGQVASGAKTLAASLATANTGAGTLANGASTLAAGTSQLNSQVPTLVNGVKTLNSGAATVNGGATKLKGGAADLKAGLTQLQGSAKDISNGIKGISAGSDVYVNALTQNKTTQEANLKAATAATTDAQKAVTSTSDSAYSSLYGAQGLAAALSGESKYLSGAQQALAAAQQIAGTMGNGGAKTAAETAKANAQTAAGNAQSAAGSVAAAKQEVANAQSAIASATDLDSAKAAAAQLSNALNNLNAAESAAGNAATNANNAASSAGEAATAASGADTTGLASTLGKAAGAITSAQGLNNQATKGLDGAKPLFGTLGSQVTALANAAGAQGGAQGAVTALDGAIKGYTTVQSGQQLSLAGAIAYMNCAINPATPTAQNPGLVAGVNSAASGANQLSDGSATLAAGTSQLATGTQTLANSTPALAGGVSQLNAGASQLKSGALTLSDAMGLLSSGAGTLSSGASELASGTQELADRTSDLDTQVIDTVKDQIEKMLNPDFTPTDFVNGEQGGHVNHVQFVFMTGAVSK